MQDLSKYEIIVTSHTRTQNQTICMVKIAGMQDSKPFTVAIPKTQFGFDFNQDGDLYIHAFLTSYINKNHQRTLKYTEQAYAIQNDNINGTNVTIFSNLDKYAA